MPNLLLADKASAILSLCATWVWYTAEILVKAAAETIFKTEHEACKEDLKESIETGNREKNIRKNARDMMKMTDTSRTQLPNLRAQLPNLKLPAQSIYCSHCDAL